MEIYVILHMEWLSINNVEASVEEKVADIRLKCVDMLDKWGIESSQLHCFVTDNNANIKKQ